MAALRDSHGELEDAKEKPERTGEAMNHMNPVFWTGFLASIV